MFSRLLLFSFLSAFSFSLFVFCWLGSFDISYTFCRLCLFQLRSSHVSLLRCSQKFQRLCSRFLPAFSHIFHSFSHPRPAPCSVFCLCLTESVIRNLCTRQKKKNLDTSDARLERLSEWKPRAFLIFRSKQRGSAPERG